MRLLFATIQGYESAFYGRVGSHLEREGAAVEHVTFSRAAAARLRARGIRARAIADEPEPAGGHGSLAPEIARICDRYGIGDLRTVWHGDPACAGRSPEWCDAFVVRHVQAVERVFDEFQPTAVVPEVGVEVLRTVVHLVSLERGVPTWFLLYTIFPDPLRLARDSLRVRIVDDEEIRALDDRERAEVDAFRKAFTERGRPIREHRRYRPTAQRIARLLGYVAARVGPDRDNPYLRPARWLREHLQGLVRATAARPLYSAPPTGPYVYFPLHVSDDYKIARVVPHLADQAAIAACLAASLPPGYELAIKEHPLSIGRQPLRWLRELSASPRIRLVPPSTSSHDLVCGAAAVAVISSTVGIEALLYRKPVLTIGEPYYSGAGVTVDVASPADAAAALPGLLAWEPDPERIDAFLHAGMRLCSPGAPVMVDATDDNARRLARTLAATCGEGRATAQAVST